MDTDIHDIFKDYKSSTLCLWIITYSNLSDLTVATKELVQVLASDLIIEILDKKDSVSSWR